MKVNTTTKTLNNITHQLKYIQMASEDKTLQRKTHNIKYIGYIGYCIIHVSVRKNVW